MNLANWWVLELFRPAEPKNVWFLRSSHDVRRVYKKIFSRWFERIDGCLSHFGLLSLKTFDSHFLDIMYVEFIKNFFSLIRANWWVLESFPPPEPKNVWFPLSRHDVRRVHKKCFFRRFARTDGCWSYFGLLSLKTFDSHFLDMMYVEFMKISFFADSSELMGVRVISASWAQKRLIPTF